MGRSWTDLEKAETSSTSKMISCASQGTLEHGIQVGHVEESIVETGMLPQGSSGKPAQEGRARLSGSGRITLRIFWTCLTCPLRMRQSLRTHLYPRQRFAEVVYMLLGGKVQVWIRFTLGC